MRLVIRPQMVKRLIPPVVNEMAALAKETSLVSVIALSEALYITQRLGAKYLCPWEVYVWAAVGCRWRERRDGDARKAPKQIMSS